MLVLDSRRYLLLMARRGRVGNISAMREKSVPKVSRACSRELLSI